MNVILSIKPKWAEKIYNGEKVIEFRNTIPKSLIRLDTFENKIHPISRKESYPGKTIFLYETGNKKVTGCCKFKDLIFDRVFFDDSGKVIVPRSYPFGREGFIEWLFYAGGEIKEKELSEYAGKKRFVWCWKITAPRRFEIAPAELKEFDLKRPPQSFCYTNYGINSEGKITLYGVDFAA